MWKYWSTCLLVAASAAAAGFLLAGYGALEPFRAAWEGRLVSSGLAGGPEWVRIPELQLLSCVLVALFAAWVTIDVIRFRNSLFVLLTTALVLAMAPVVLALYGVLFEPVAALVSLSVAFCLGTAFSGSPAGARRRRSARLLAGRGGSSLVTEGARPGSTLERAGGRTVSVITLRVTNVGDLVDAADPGDSAALQNRFFHGCRALLVGANAHVDQAGPDCLRATFGAVGPGQGTGHAAEACAAALALRDCARKLTGEEDKDVEEPLRFGIGVTTGKAIAGVFSGNPDGSFGVLSEANELGSRLAAANRIYGSRLLIGPVTRELAEESIEVRPVEMVFDPVSRSLVEVYELLAKKGELSPESAERRDRFWEGVVLARAGRFGAAKEKLESAMTGEETDFPLEHMLGVVRRELASSTSKGIRPSVGFPEEIQIRPPPSRGLTPDRPTGSKEWTGREPGASSRSVADRLCHHQRFFRLRAHSIMPSIDYPEPVSALVEQLKRLPGIGPRSAERIAIWVLGGNSQSAGDLAEALLRARGEIAWCDTCGFFSSRAGGCPVCRDTRRDPGVMCVVEQPTDVLPLERSGSYRGLYHVLGGRLSPLDGVGPEQLRIAGLLARLGAGGFTEVILALSADVEGEATSNFLGDLLRKSEVTVTRIAQGLPAGGGLEHADPLTLSRALDGRR